MATDYATLFHAYGRAVDTPAHLEALTSDDHEARTAAFRHLWSAVIHQGTPWTATPPAAERVAALVGDPRLDASDRASLLRFLAAVAEATQPGYDAGELAAMAYPPGRDLEAEFAAADEDEAYGDEVLANAMYSRAILGCRAVVPAALAAAAPLLADPDAEVRSAAAYAAGACAKALGPAADPAPLAARLDALAAEAGPDERAALVLSMGELGLAPRAYLDDPHPGVRACAALAPALADDPAATAAILEALADPAATERWFTHRPPQLHTHIRFRLTHAAIERVDDPERLLPAALALAPIAGPWNANSDWGPLLLAILGPRRDGPLTDPQRRYLAALVDNEALWDPRNGNASLAMREAGLPHDRAACRALTS
ncbi:hypothetical protein GCM10022255_070600 [Dactylosporangium darangshiense]|uniref:HEAT repeat domain-containing protein n=2 Tax=Dactylosporangium darangshiense TaxID=579108 RepID=A0ABP8DI72_9ACTN